MDEAFESWNRLVFTPLMDALEEYKLEIEFPDLGNDELFIQVSEHWYCLKKKNFVSAIEAVLSYGSVFA